MILIFKFGGSPVSIEEGLATGSRDVASQHLKGGRLPGPVDSQQAEALVEQGRLGMTDIPTQQCWCEQGTEKLRP